MPSTFANRSGKLTTLFLHVFAYFVSAWQRETRNKPQIEKITIGYGARFRCQFEKKLTFIFWTVINAE